MKEDFVPPNFEKLPCRDCPDCSRGGMRGLFFGSILGLVLAAALFWLTNSLLSVAPLALFAYLGYAMRHCRKPAHCRRPAEPPQVLW